MGSGGGLEEKSATVEKEKAFFFPNVTYDKDAHFKDI